MLCLIHGYSLTGSGSNLWTRFIARGLCQAGETIHVVCQESRPERYDFITEAWSYDADGRPEKVFERDSPYAGRCIVHRPHVDVLPVFVPPPPDLKTMARIVDMPRADLDAYLGYQEAALRRVVEDHGIEAMHVNHVVLMAVAAQRVSEATGVPFAVMPHGSAIEYVVKHDESMHALATEALTKAHRIFTLSEEMQTRIADVFPGVPDAADKMVMASAGVDTSQFQVIPRDERPAAIARFRAAVAESERGKSPADRAATRDRLRDDMTLEELQEALRAGADYRPKLPDADLEQALEAVDWTQDDILIFVGKLIGYKGLPSIVAALPEILAERPRTRLILAGRGQLREALEALVWALAHGKQTLARNIARWGGALESEAPEPFTRLERFFDALEDEGLLEAYFERARTYVDEKNVLFPGYLEHDALSNLLPCCDVAIFPSVVKEAAPLVVPEAMASGVFPMGTDFAGMAASLDVAARAVPPDVKPYLRLRPDPEHTVRDIIDNVQHALRVTDDHRRDFRQVAEDNYDWRSVAGRLADVMRAM